jgi:hypothetical protein
MEQEYFTKFVYGVYTELDEPDNFSIAKISAWFLDNANVGKLNNLIGTQISGVAYKDQYGVVTGYDLVPNPSNDQLAIYKMMFDFEYFKNQARFATSSSLVEGEDWVTLGEGDSRVQRINKNEIAKNYRALARDIKQDLDKAVKMYLKYNSIPDQIVGDDTEGISNYIIQEYNRTLN